MDQHGASGELRPVIATIKNKNDSGQIVVIQYLREKNAFVTSGIAACFAEKEILIPGELAVMDFDLIGTILSAILEKLSQACETESVFSYVNRFQVLEKTFTLTQEDSYMRLDML